MLTALIFCAATGVNVDTITDTLSAPIAESAAIGVKAKQWQQQKAIEHSEQQQALAELYWTEFQIAKLERQVTEQQQQIATLTDELNNIDAIAQQLEPSLEVWYAELERLVAADMPFLTEERQRRLRFFRQSLDNADIPQAERFRRLMEVIQIEVDQGYGSVVANHPIQLQGQNIQVTSFRLGRLLWLAQSQDGSVNAYFDTAFGGWKTLDPRYASAIKDAIAISKNQQRAELLALPLPHKGEQ
ncbi:DUF3450 domain-containing protein [Ferrimonas aestuarii]|uniref:DUF3450 domain-containing protein n=1 Tax=Ferrimonas aestuarii TaxID=2569539 RepID=A0A4U1BY61_9GAMM|nr:DUF3450 domain-containing protein [Ferrimonas aestuarii]TKB58685.1 DUF3450 domain-containing protein [Ferrimonas aestuarii]